MCIRDSFDGEPEPSVTNIPTEEISVFDSIEELVADDPIEPEPVAPEPEEEPAIKVDTQSTRQAALQKKARRLDEERKKVIQEIHDDDAHLTINTLPPKTVAKAADVPQVGKPFVKDHK